MGRIIRRSWRIWSCRRSEQTELPWLARLVVEHRSSAQLRRDRALVRENGVEIGLRAVTLLDGADELVQALHPVQLVGLPKPSPIQARPEYVDRRIVGAERNRKRVAVLASVRKGEPGRIGESRWRAMNDLGDQ